MATSICTTPGETVGNGRQPFSVASFQNFQILMLRPLPKPPHFPKYVKPETLNIQPLIKERP
jgi:hypothetical protein